MILLSTTPEERECVTCRECGAKVSIPCVQIIDELPKLRLLLNGTLNALACDGCGELVIADVPVWVRMEEHGIDPLFHVPLDYLELGYLDPTDLSPPGDADRIYYSLEELACQVRARILIHRLPIEA